MLDEPFAGVDPIAVEDIQYIVYKLKEKNIGILRGLAVGGHFEKCQRIPHGGDGGSQAHSSAHR